MCLLRVLESFVDAEYILQWIGVEIFINDGVLIYIFIYAVFFLSNIKNILRLFT